MRICLAAALLLHVLFLPAGTVAGDGPQVIVTKTGASAPIGQVLELTPDNFAEHVAGEVSIFVKFYAPWCGHCKKIAPTWRELAGKIVAEPGLKFKTIIADVNADDHKELAAEYDVKAFPTFVHFPPKNTSQMPVHYNGKQSIPEWINYLKQRSISQLSSKRQTTRVFALDVLAFKFYAADDELTRQDMMARVKGVIDSETTPEAMKHSAGIYLKLMEKALKSDDFSGFFQYEGDRLDRLIKSGQLSDEKLREVSARRSILGGFVEEPVLPGGVHLPMQGKGKEN